METGSRTPQPSSHINQITLSPLFLLFSKALLPQSPTKLNESPPATQLLWKRKRPMSLLTLLSLLLLLPFISSSTNETYNKQSSSLQAMTMDPFERETLFHVMEAMSSDRNWRVSNPEPCSPGSSWPGLECKPLEDNHLHVTRLDFGNSPNPTCKSSATFPTEVFHLPHLQSLFFFNCFKTTKTTLTISPPSSHSRPSSSLQKISFKSNPALVGPIPSHLSSLTSLQVLTLSQNRLYGKIPESLSLLTSLIHLDLSYNSLVGPIPAQISGLKNLVDLDLSYNSLTGPIPASIGHLGLLQKLDLSSNSLSGAMPESLGNLSLLTFLALSNNKLSGEFPEGLPYLQSLQYLIMDDNPMLVPLPFQLGRLVRLQELRLANSGYSGSIPGSFGWLTNLTTLSLENNRLTGKIPAGLSALARIYHLNLSRNLLGGVVPFGAGFIRRLGRNLDLSGNPGLCVDGSERFEGVKVGIGVCGANRSGPAFHQTLVGSNGAVSQYYCNLSHLFLGFIISVLGLYHWLL